MFGISDFGSSFGGFSQKFDVPATFDGPNLGIAKPPAGLDLNQNFWDTSIDPIEAFSAAADFGSAIELGTSFRQAGGLGSFGGGAAGANIPDEYYFITTPADINWGKGSSQVMLDTYGTNAPYVQYGNTQLRKLSIGNALLEGFSDGKEVEANVTNLEACMDMVINPGGGFAAPYVWKVFSGDKSYGNFVITGVRIKEEMRDLTGRATRAYADVEFQEVPDYQISSGVDLASQSGFAQLSKGAESALLALNSALGQDGKVNATNALNAANSAVNGANGSGVPNPTAPPPSLDPTQSSAQGETLRERAIRIRQGLNP